jgi:hypothetical protein
LAEYLPVGTYLELVRRFRGEQNHHVWGGLASGLRTLAEIFVGDKQVPRLEEFAGDLLRPIVEEVGWDPCQPPKSDWRSRLQLCS